MLAFQGIASGFRSSSLVDGMTQVIVVLLERKPFGDRLPLAMSFVDGVHSGRIHWESRFDGVTACWYRSSSRVGIVEGPRDCPWIGDLLG